MVAGKSTAGQKQMALLRSLIRACRWQQNACRGFGQSPELDGTGLSRSIYREHIQSPKITCGGDLAFTDPSGAAAAWPLFDTHYQPHIPADLGFYDLRLPAVRAQQASLARQYGIHGFCYHYYWFSGRRISG